MISLTLLNDECTVARILAESRKQLAAAVERRIPAVGAEGQRSLEVAQSRLAEMDAFIARALPSEVRT